MYSLDTSMFLDWQARYYPLDVFRSLELKIGQLIYTLNHSGISPLSGINRLRG